MSAHSPGPWKVCSASRGHCPCGLVWSAGGEYVIASVSRADMDHEKSDDLYEANWRLIAAAPELLAALKHAIGCARDGFGHVRTDRGRCSGCDGLQDAQALIRRIEGTP